jgi:glycosyltransferase involved in cell wall biosynthesis
MFDFIFELPHINPYSGGITRSLVLAKELAKEFKIHVRIQNLRNVLPDIPFEYSVGLPSQKLPDSKYIITYSDNPYTADLIKNNKKSKIFVLMLSYGMCLEREKPNALNKSLIVLASTRRTENLIKSHGGKCHYISFGYSDTEFYPDVKYKKENVAAIYYAWQSDKNYEMAVKICNALFKLRLIKGCLSFGEKKDYGIHKHPACLLGHYQNANKEEVRRVFSRSSIFVMPSSTEGLNRTPIESTLCGCPAVICDGAIGDVFFNGETCFIAQKNNFKDILEKSKCLIQNEKYRISFKEKIENILKNYTVQNVVTNLKKLL